MFKSRLRRLPFVFRLAGAIVLIALVGGQVWQRQPAGAATTRLLAVVARACPAAAAKIATPTIADGAHALDRWGWRVIANQVAPRSISRSAKSKARS